MSREANSVTVNWTPARAQYEQDGYVVFQNVLDAELVAEGRAHVDWLQARHPNLRPEQLGHWLVTHDAFWVRLVSDDRLLDIAEQFIGPNIALFASHYICKPPYDGQPVLWHQDGSYWPLTPMEVVTLWLAIDDSVPENGCMRVIPRTQHESLRELKQRKDIANVLESGMDESLVDESKAVDVVVRAGGVSVHHPNIIHGSNANTSPVWRRGLTIRYIPTTTQIGGLKPGERQPSAFLLRGAEVSGLNDYNSWPAYDPAHSMPFRGCEAWK
ncbi:MAG: phytanoyl-CoA dioxygenase family protein [Candidatus Hydrogenedentes bacterium]|nr:phytanoyl-CoA dioxygenase family protein [Candidatus Hydrogenedentota bacterium]